MLADEAARDDLSRRLLKYCVLFTGGWSLADDAGVSNPKLHHYVPQFYLRRFTDPAGRLWVWDRDRDRVFPTRPGSVAAESDFYFLRDLAEQGYDPLTMESQFADLESNVSAITGQWLDWIRRGVQGEVLPVPDVNRHAVSLFLVLQFLRTADARSILADFAKTAGYAVESDEDSRALHTDMLWRIDELISPLVKRVECSTWLFGRNATSTPFITSDNPVAWRTSDNRMWLKAAIQTVGTYIVYPLAPDAVMYCYPNEGRWRNARVSRFDCCISPVTFTVAMVQDENTAQVFMASRFVISNVAAFDHQRKFAKTIGTDTYARPGARFSE